MRKILTLLMILLFVAPVFSQHKPEVINKTKMMVKLDNSNVTDNTPSVTHWPTITNRYAPAGTVPFPLNYNDYQTNGNNQRRLVVIGDTIIVGADINADLGIPPSATVGRIYYQVSYNAGTTWETEALNISPSVSLRWPNISPVILSGSRSIVFTGRAYATAQSGVSVVEAILGLGSCQNYITPNAYRDFFGYYKNSTTVGGIISASAGAATDSLYYYNFNYVTGTYSGKVMIAPNLEASFRYYIAIANNGQNILASYWRSATPQSLNVYESVNGGTSFSAGTIIHQTGVVVGTDSTDTWFGADVAYKPGSSTVKGMAFNTLGVTYNFPNQYKVLYWNGSALKVVCDWQKYYFLRDTASYPPVGQFYNHYVGQQVGMTYLSHPSLAWSDDGSILYCAFTAIQKDTSNFGGTYLNYNLNDVFICWSTDEGNTWSNAYYVTNTTTRDELYPTLSKTGNTNTTFNIVYSESGSPGSFTFNDGAPPDTTYTVFKRINRNTLAMVPVGISQISTEVPGTFALSQNYPNPFNPTTKINFAVSKVGYVSLKVYDITGKIVGDLVNQKLGVGTYEYQFNGQGLSSGIYFYTLKADGFSETKKMMLIK